MSVILVTCRLALKPEQRIKSLSGESSLEFIGVRAAGHVACAYSDEPVRTVVNCNPNCNPWRDGAASRGGQSGQIL